MTDYNDVIRQTFGEEPDAAAAQVVGTVEDDPNKAMRAIDLGRSLDVNPSVIYSDIESFERNNKARLAADLVRNNHNLSTYVTSNPMAAKVSNDDFGQLDEVSQKLDPFTKVARSEAKAFIEAFKEGFDLPGLQAEYDKLVDYIDDPMWKSFVTKSGFGAAAIALDGAMRAIKGGMFGVAGVVAEDAKQLGMSDADAAKLARDTVILQQILPMTRFAKTGIHPEMVTQINDAARAVKAAKPYVAADRAPPVGLDPLLDDKIVEQSKGDLSKLDDVFKQAQASATRERAPELFEQFLAQHTDAKIGISADAIARLYGEKKPTPDDNILGWVPDLKEQLEVGVSTGGDVSIPLSAWLAKVDPEIAKALHDDIRVRPGGVTKAEEKPIADYKAASQALSIDVYHGSPHEFDAFDIGKAGTGEGAQVYGHGHYVAENPKVAETYKAAGARSRNKWSINGKVIDAEGIKTLDNAATPEAAVALWMDLTGTRENALAAAEKELKKNPEQFNEDVVNILKEGAVQPIQRGNHYNVRIKREPHEFLDWDKPLSEQPEFHAKIVQIAKDKLTSAKTDKQKNNLQSLIQFDDLTPNDARVFLRDALGSDKAVSDALAEQGIAGIKYLDQFSREALTPEEAAALKQRLQQDLDYIRAHPEEFEASKAKIEIGELENRLQLIDERIRPQTRNYVVFRDEDLQVIARNGQAVNAVRQSAQLKPMFEGLQEPRLTLQKLDEGGDAEVKFHTFAVNNPQGKRVMDLTFSEIEGGKHLRIEEITGVGNQGINSFGPSMMRDILRQIKEQFPLAEELSGYRVSGAREAAGEKYAEVSIPLKGIKSSAAQITDLEHFVAIAEGGDYLDYGLGTKALIKPKELWTKNEKLISDAVDAEIKRIAPQAVTVHAAHDIVLENGQHPSGLHLQFYDRAPVILWSLDHTDSIATARHEALHHLRKTGFFREKEWETLENAALSEGWLAKHDIEAKYPELPRAQQIEEAVAYEFQYWRRGGELDSAVQPVFQRLRDLLDGIREKIKNIIGYQPTWQELFDLADAGDIGKRRDFKPIDPDIYQVGYRSEARFPKQLELDVTRMEDREVFAKASSIGMTVDQYKRYMRLIEKRDAEDVAKAMEKAEASERRRQTKTWKENEAVERERAVEMVNARPDVAADKLFREGVLFGERVGTPPKLGEAFLTEEQRAALPKKYYGPDGLHPDDVAPLFGYQTGAEMINRLAGFEAERQALRIRADTQIRNLVGQTTDQLMKEKYGDLDENVLREAKDQVLGQTQLDLLHEETVYLAEKAGAQLPLPDFKAQIEQQMFGLKVGDINADKLLAAAGRAGKQAEMELLKGDFVEAFKQKQRQYNSIVAARAAGEVEKAVTDFEATAKRFQQRQVSGVEQEFTDYIHEMLVGAGLPVKRSLQEIQDNQLRHGYASFDAFVKAKTGDGWELAVPDYLAAKQWKPYVEMTVEDFRDFKDAVDSLAYVGKEVNKIEVAGRRQEFADFKQQVLDNIRSLPPRTKGQKIRLRFDAEMVRMEEVVKDLDLREAAGPLFNAMIRPMAESKHTEYTMLEKLSKKLTEIRGFNKGWQRTLNDTIPQDFFHDIDGTPFDLTREHMINIMLNFGNRSNINKFTQGWVGKEEAAAFEAKLRTMFDTHAKKEDWDFVQKVWDLFEDWRKESDKLYYDLSGIAPRWIQATQVDTVHGPYKGGYFPVIYDKWRSGINLVEEKTDPNSLFGTNYFRATPGNSYTKSRTGYTDFVEFEGSIERVAQRMQQMIHDISYRRAVMDVNKVIHDRQIRAAIRQHYGAEYEAQLYPWLKDIANHFNSNEQAVSMTNSFLRRLRFNLMGHALGLNLKVLLSPDLGALNPIEVARTLANPAEATANAYKYSKEIPHTFRNMDRDFRERLEQTMAVKGWAEFQGDAQRWAFYPLVKVSQAFRIMTFNEAFRKGIERGMSKGDAAAHADSLVRERHGSAGLPDLPAIMRSSEAMKVNTLFYGYFNAMYNWQRQIKGNLERQEWTNAMTNFYGSVLVGSFFGGALFNQQKEGDSWFKVMAKALLLQPLSTVVFLRDGAATFIEGFPSSTPLSGFLKAAASVYSDGKKWLQNKPMEKPIQHVANVIGLSTGLPMGQIGRTSQFYSDVYQRKQRPRNILEYIRGTIHGEARLKK